MDELQELEKLKGLLEISAFCENILFSEGP